MSVRQRASVSAAVFGAPLLIALLVVPSRCLVPDCPPSVSCTTTCYDVFGMHLPFDTAVSAPLLLGLAGGFSVLAIALLFWIALSLRPRSPNR